MDADLLRKEIAIREKYNSLNNSDFYSDFVWTSTLRLFGSRMMSSYVGGCSLF